MNSKDIIHLYDETYFLGGRSKFNGKIIGVGGMKEFRAGGISTKKLAVVKMVDIKDKVVFDVGFGRGDVLRHCLKTAKKCIGIDYSPAAYKIASEAVPEATLYQLAVSDIDQMPETGIDVVFLMEILEHVSTEEWKEFFSKLMPKLNEGAVVVGTTPSHRMGDYMQMHNNYWSKAKLYELLEYYFGTVEIKKGPKFIVRCYA
jgi:cyclopropane fatty-acyl-phospholipid synthase-like methyltransferase